MKPSSRDANDLARVCEGAIARLESVAQSLSGGLILVTSEHLQRLESERDEARANLSRQTSHMRPGARDVHELAHVYRCAIARYESVSRKLAGGSTVVTAEDLYRLEKEREEARAKLAEVVPEHELLALA